MRYQGSHIDSYPAVATASVFLPDERKMKKTTEDKTKAKRRDGGDTLYHRDSMNLMRNILPSSFPVQFK